MAVTTRSQARARATAAPAVRSPASWPRITFAILFACVVLCMATPQAQELAAAWRFDALPVALPPAFPAAFAAARGWATDAASSVSQRLSAAYAQHA